MSLKWKMTVPILLIVIIIIGGFAAFLYSSIQRNMEEQGTALVDSIALGIEGASKARLVSEEILEKEMVAESVLLSYALDKGATYEDLKQITEKGGMDELWSTDSFGNTTVNSIAPKVDFNFGADPNGQAYEYMKLLTGEESVIVQPAQIRTVDDQFFKFVGVGSWDKENPQIVQVARNGQMLLDLEDQIGAEFFMQQINEHLGKTILYASLVNANGESIVATSSDPLTAAGFPEEQIASVDQPFSGAFHNKKTMNYIKPLSNGNFLAISVSNEILTRILKATIISSLIAILLISSVVLVIVHGQVRRISAVHDSLVEISEGNADLTKRIIVRKNDEIGRLVDGFNRMLANFQSIMAELKGKAASVYESTNRIQVGMQKTVEAATTIQQESGKVEEGARSQLYSTEDSSKAMEDVARGVQHITDSVVAIVDLSKEAETSALRGENILTDLLQQLSIINAATGHSMEKMTELVSLSNMIGEFTHLITSISEQTNLLALNASIEAARAGDSGKGFAIVAEEVRNLAEQSKVSAEKISRVSLNVQLETKQIIEAIEKSVHDVKEGSAIADQANRSFQHIVKQIHQIAEEVEMVSAASEEMAAGTEEAAASFGEIAAVSGQSVERTAEMAFATANQKESISEMASSVKTLYRISEELKTTTDQYKV